jgi:hypothetical protein
MPTHDLSGLSTAFVGGAEVYRKQLLQWNIRKFGIQVRTNVNTPQALTKFAAAGNAQPYRKQDDFNGTLSDDRILNVYMGKLDQELDPEDFRNTYMAELPEMPFNDYAIQAGGEKFLSDLMSNTLWTGVRNAAGTAAADICDGWGTIIAAAITATDLTEVATGAVTSANAVTQVEAVYEACPTWMKEKEEGIIIYCSYNILEKYKKHYRTLNAFGFKRDEKGQYTLDGANAVLMPVSFMGASQRIVATLRGNLVFGTDAEGLTNHPTPHLNLLRNRIMFASGCQIKDLDAIMVNDQA